MTIAGDEAVKRYLDQAFWPWGVALAYCQPVEDRERAIPAVIAGLELYASHDREQSYTGAASYSGVTDGQKLGWSDFATVEQRLLGPVQVGQIEVVGRASPTGRLEPIPVVDWVGGEVDYDHTCDLVRAGWRDKDPLGQALDGPRQTIWYDLHLSGAAVRQLAAAVDARSAKSGDGGTWDEDVIDDCLSRAKRPREGLWSAWSALAWVASRDDRFVAAVQLFEDEQHADRGDVYTHSAWMTLGNKAGEAWGRTFTDAFSDLKEALGNGDISASAITGRFGKRRAVEVFEWGDANVSYERLGLSLIGGMHSFLFPASEVRAAFPVAIQPHEIVGIESPAPLQQDLEGQLVDGEARVHGAPRFDGRWTQRVPTPQARLAFEFFQKARRHLSGGTAPLSPTELRRTYVSWLKKAYPGAAPYARSVFQTWLDRYEDGWRIAQSGKSLVHLPD